MCDLLYCSNTPNTTVIASYKFIVFYFRVYISCRWQEDLTASILYPFPKLVINFYDINLYLTIRD